MKFWLSYRGLQKVVKHLGKCDIWTDLEVIKKRAPLHGLFIFRTDAPMTFRSFIFCQKLKILAKSNRGIKSSEKLWENVTFG